MGEISAIAWTHATFNPWWGCTRVSPGCEHCYAEQLATVRRKLPVWGVDAERKPMSEAYWREPAKWNRKAEARGERMRVFCASMADVFETPPARNVTANKVVEHGRSRLWPLIESTPWLDWLLLTKRPQNVMDLVPRVWLMGGFPHNVWLGTTTEDQKRYDERWPILASIPARVRFISHEPALEAIALSGSVVPDWVITGGESGRGARGYNPSWAKDLISQCRRFGAAPFVKQLGANVLDFAGAITGKGDDPAEWPAELRVQEFPRATERRA